MTKADLVEEVSRVSELTKKDAERAKNMFALGLLSWLYNRPTEGTVAFLKTKFARVPEILQANLVAFQAVTVGTQAEPLYQRLERDGEYSSGLYIRGLASSTAEALAGVVNG